MTFILTFGSTHRALKAESLLISADLPFRLDPAPKALVKYCDLVIKVEGDVLDRVVETLSGGGALPVNTYKKIGDSYDEV